jgi:hypothetical protein
MTLIYLIAGEASGDVLGARLMRAIVARRPADGLKGKALGNQLTYKNRLGDDLVDERIYPDLNPAAGAAPS